MSLFAKQVFTLGTTLRATRSIQTSVAHQSGLSKWIFSASGYNKYGLLTDDLMDEDHNADVKEAVRRLPDHIVDERHYRMIRAMQLSIQKSILPKEQWTKYEDDVLYLQPYLKEVVAERKEREDWEATH